MMWTKLRRKIILLVMSIAVMGLILHQHHFISRKLDFTLDFTPAGFDVHDFKTRQSMHYSNYKFLLDEEFSKRIRNWDSFSLKSQTEKCEVFFKLVDEKIPGWEVRALRDRLFDKNAVRKGEFFKSKQSQLLKEKGRESSYSITEEDKRSINRAYEENLRNTKRTEQEMADTMTIIRIFSRCFLNPSDPSVKDDLKDIYHRYSKKILSFLQNELPDSSTGDVVSTTEWFGGAPKLERDGNILDYYYQNMKGSGIVLSAATKHTRDIIKLIHVLRALGNSLPIEIMYRADLSMKAKQSIMIACTSTKEELMGTQLSDHKILEKSLKQAGLKLSDLSALKFPTQNVTLINIQKPIAGTARTVFSGYNSKILALFFSSFEKVLLFDADSVPLVSPESIFKMEEYIATGAYFFKDRTLMDRNDWIETNFFAKLMPHETNKVDIAMGVKPVSEHTLGNHYMAGWRHCQEAGVIAIDKKLHLGALLNLFPLSMWGEPIKSSIWGDKEMYWLAMSIAGDENYTFNKYGAASVGELTSDVSRKQYNNSISLELCSSHPGHISANGRLIWINSGFSYCKKNGYVRDKSKFPFSLNENRDEIRELYELPLKIRHAIVPPDIPALRPLDGSPDQSAEAKLIEYFKSRKPDVDGKIDAVQIAEYDPQKGWVKNPTCTNYQYCAYTAIESFEHPGSLDESGSVFRFDEDISKLYDVLGAIWLSAVRNNYIAPQTTESGSGVVSNVGLAESSLNSANPVSDIQSEIDSLMKNFPVKGDSLDGGSEDFSQSASAQNLEVQNGDVKVVDHSGDLLRMADSEASKDDTQDISKPSPLTSIPKKELIT